jgi:hypothetical protein
MSRSEVGSGHIAIFATFKGTRASIDSFIGGATTAAGKTFNTGFTKSATATGTSAGKSFKASFQSSTSGLVEKATAEVAKASRELSTGRARELDLAGRLRVAEAQLGEARKKYAGDSSQVIRALERQQSAERALQSVQDSVKGSTDRLATAKRSLATATTRASEEATRSNGVWARLNTTFGSAGSQSAQSFGSSFKTSFGTVFGANFAANVAFAAGRRIGQGISDGISFAFDGIQLASDLGETTTAVQQVFGAAAADIQSFASSANTALGQTRTQALRGAQTFGVFAQQAGLTGKPLSDFSTGLVSLSTDLASFYNSSPEEAINAIGAGLRGEAEPLRRFGVLLDDATLRAKALALGIYDGSGALTGQQRVLAAQAVIYDQTAIAQGDFARTSGGLANQQRILAASLEDSQAKLGEYLLPGFTAFVQYANAEIIPRIGDLIEKVGPQLAGALENSGPIFDDFLNLASDGLEGLGLWLDGVGTAYKELKNFGYDLGANSEDFRIDLTTGGALTTLLDEQVEVVKENAAKGGLLISQSYANSILEGLDGTEGPIGALMALKLQQALDSGAVVVSDANTRGPYYLGSMFVEGVKRGVDSKYPELMNSVTALGTGMGVTLQGALDSHSPSRLGERLGGTFPDGVGLGIRKRTFVATDATKAMATAITAAASSGSPSGMYLSAGYAPGAGVAAAGGGTSYTLVNPDPEVLLAMLHQRIEGGLPRL